MPNISSYCRLVLPRASHEPLPNTGTADTGDVLTSGALCPACSGRRSSPFSTGWRVWPGSSCWEVRAVVAGSSGAGWRLRSTPVVVGGLVPARRVSGLGCHPLPGLPRQNSPRILHECFPSSTLFGCPSAGISAWQYNCNKENPDTYTDVCLTAYAQLAWCV